VEQFLVLRARTVRVEGRKAWVEGWIETMPGIEQGEEGEGRHLKGAQPEVLVTASALFIEPKGAGVSCDIYIQKVVIYAN
jgi:hypothetical protein